MIQKAKFKKGALLEDSRFAAYEDEIVFIIDDDIIIHNNEIITNFDVAHYRKIFKILETVD